jgi:hypothetical protein
MTGGAGKPAGRAFRELRSRVSWITEGGGPKVTLTRAEQWAVSIG